jgi:hypothetical protein
MENNVETIASESEIASSGSSEEADPKVTNGGAFLTPAQWQEIRTYYERGEKKTPELAELYGITRSAISQHFKKHKVVWASRAISEATSGLTAPPPPPAALTFEDKRSSRIEQTREESYNWARIIAVESMKAIMEARAAGTPIGTLKEVIRVFRMQTALLAESGTFRLNILEADKHVNEEVLPSIKIEDLSEDDIKLIRSGEEDDIDLDEDEVITE